MMSCNKRSRRSSATALFALAVLLVGCQPSSARDEQRPRPTPEPEQLRQALYEGYVTPPGVKQECLGRLVFDAPRDMQWGVGPLRFPWVRYGFNERMHGGHDDLWISGTQVLVLVESKQSDLRILVREVEAEKSIAIREYRARATTARRMMERSKSQLADPESGFTEEEKASIRKAVATDEQELAEIDKNIGLIEKSWHPMDLGLPDALGYQAGPDLHAFLLRNGRVYKFLRASGEGDPPFDQRKREFLELVQRFQPRKLHEIPTVRGICVPFGFIPDDGTLPARIEVSLRSLEHPGVIYTIGSKVVGEQGVNGSEPALLKAIGRAGGAGFALGLGREVKAIGPGKALIGALPAQQGGIAMNVADEGQPVVHGYSVYTGYGGWGHSRVLPALTVDMRSFTKKQEPELVNRNPPPLKEAMARYEALLKSIRLRPTQPPMPELAAATK